jgi:hypothetical protein
MTITFQPRKPFQRRPRPDEGLALGPLPPAQLVLVSAYYDDMDIRLQLGFDRKIDMSAFDGSGIFVRDGTFHGMLYVATGSWEFLTDTTIKVSLDPVEELVGEDVELTAGDSTGITAVDDGGTWPGVSGVGLPLT